MRSELWLAASAALGGVLALIHFGGLWLTLKDMHKRDSPKRFFWLSFLVRNAVTLGGLWAVLHLGLWEFAAAFAAFIIVRLAFVRCLGGGSGPRKEQAWK